MTNFNSTAWERAPRSASRLPSSLASVNATLVAAGGGSVFMINGLNATAGVKYLKLYDKATAPTVGTDVPVVTLALPASAPFEFNLEGFRFQLGIGFGLVTGAADASAVAVAAGDILGQNILYA